MARNEKETKEKLQDVLLTWFKILKDKLYQNYNRYANFESLRSYTLLKCTLHKNPSTVKNVYPCMQTKKNAKNESLTTHYMAVSWWTCTCSVPFFFCKKIISRVAGVILIRWYCKLQKVQLLIAGAIGKGSSSNTNKIEIEFNFSPNKRFSRCR